MSTTIKKEVCIIGGGIAGLFAGIYLAKAGLTSIIIEKRKVLGGRIGTFIQDNREFTIACNDFGKGLEQECRRLDINMTFHRPKTVLIVANRIFEFPFSFKTFMGKRDGELTLATFFDKHIKSPMARDLLNPLSYPLGLMENQIDMRYLRDEIKNKYGYGYAQPRTPRGGPKALIDALTAKYKELGGTVLTGLTVETPATKKREIIAGKYRIMAKDIFTSQGRWAEFPPNTATGLHYGMFLVSLRQNLFPKNTHTLAFLPAGIANYMYALNKGVLPNQFGFHLFRSGAEAYTPPYNFNILFYLPRDRLTLTPTQLVGINSFIFLQIEKTIPGFQQSIEFNQYLAPTDFETLHGFTSQPTVLQVPTWLNKPSVFDSKTGLYYLGNSVGPPGDHAGQAVLSAKWTVQALMQRYNQS